MCCSSVWFFFFLYLWGACNLNCCWSVFTHYYCFETVSVSNCGWPDTCHVDQSSFELPEIHLTLLLKIKGSTSAFLSQALTLSQLALIVAAVLLPSTPMGAHGSLKPVTPPLGDPVLSSVLWGTRYKVGVDLHVDTSHAVRHCWRSDLELCAC